VYGVVYCLVSVGMSFGIFNVIIAIFVENTMATVKNDELVQRQRRLDDHGHFAEKVFRLSRFFWDMQHPDEPETCFTLQEFQQIEITKAFYSEVSDHSMLHSLLEDLDVPREDHVDLFEICDADGSGSLTIDELVLGIKRLRGDARRSDVVFIMLRVRELMQEIRRFKEELCLEISSIKNEMAGSAASMSSLSKPLANDFDNLESSKAMKNPFGSTMCDL